MIIGGKPRHSFRVKLASGREVRMARVYMDYTYGGVLEGDPTFLHDDPEYWYEAAVRTSSALGSTKSSADEASGSSSPNCGTLRPFPPSPTSPTCGFWRTVRRRAVTGKLRWPSSGSRIPSTSRSSSASRERCRRRLGTRLPSN
jgi:hypothetical protein